MGTSLFSLRRALVRICASVGAATLALAAHGQRLTSFTVSPNAIYCGYTATGSLSIDTAAPVGGTTIELQEQSGGAATFPSTVTVTSGNTSATFSIQTSVVSSQTAEKIRAILNRGSREVTFGVYPASIRSVAVSPGNVYSGAAASGTVTLTSQAPTGGTTVSLASSTADATVPSSVTVPAGQTSTTFTLTAGEISGQESATITATVGSSAQHATVGLYPAAFASVEVFPFVVYPGQSMTGTVSLEGVAPSGGDTINLQISDGSMTIPATVSVPEGQTSANFTIGTSAVVTSATVTASFSIWTRYAQVSVISSRLMPSAWPKSGGDLWNTGRGQGSGAVGNLLFAHSIAGGAGYETSSPAIDKNGNVYVGSVNGYLHSLDASTGAEAWASGTNGGCQSSPAIGSDGTIYVGSVSNQLLAFNADGTAKWTLNTDQSLQLSSPTIGPDDTVYISTSSSAVTPSGSVYAVNGQTGAVIWRYQFTNDEQFYCPALGSDGTLYVSTNGGYLYAFNHDGSVKFSVQLAGAFNCSVSIGNAGDLFLIDTSGYLYCVDGQTGYLIWDSLIDSNPNGPYPAPSIGSDGTVYIECGDGYIRAMNPSSGSLEWATFTDGAGFDGQLAIGTDGTLYGGSLQGIFYALNPSDGSVEWTYSTGYAFEGGPAIAANGTVYVQDDSGTVYSFN